MSTHKRCSIYLIKEIFNIFESLDQAFNFPLAFLDVCSKLGLLLYQHLPSGSTAKLQARQFQCAMTVFVGEQHLQLPLLAVDLLLLRLQAALLLLRLLSKLSDLENHVQGG